jgi:hypothetical protein
VEPVLFYLAGFVATAFIQLICSLSYKQSSRQTGSTAVEMPHSTLECSTWSRAFELDEGVSRSSIGG